MAMGPTTEGYSLASMAIESPSRQSRLSATMETPSATLQTKPISPADTPHSRAMPARAASISASCAVRPGSAAAFVGDIAQQCLVMGAQRRGFATGADMGDAGGQAEIGRIEQWVHRLSP